MNYEPVPRSVHELRGHCCESVPWCVFCPYRDKPVFQPLNISPWIEEALRSGEPTIYYSDRMSLVPQLTIQNLTIIYKDYQKQ